MFRPLGPLSLQAQRDKASKLFHDSTNVVLFTSDVTARGLDYPDVTAVVQVTNYNIA